MVFNLKSIRKTVNHKTCVSMRNYSSLISSIKLNVEYKNKILIIIYSLRKINLRCVQKNERRRSRK